MDLSPEDSLRLNVLLANKPQAIRIHESSMTVFGLSDKGDAKIPLNANCREDQYIKKVKELISGHVLGSPGGYPIYLQRWTRMGQMRDESLEQLLLLGEPEAIIAAACAQGLTDELARRAWWAMEDAENARRMLNKEAVVQGEMGPILAEYLVEHLPFESEAEKQIETVRLVLKPGLLLEATAAGLWRKAQRKPAYYIGFIASLPDDIPETQQSSPLLSGFLSILQPFADEGNTVAISLLRILSSQGQAYLATLHKIFKKPTNQDVVNSTIDLIAEYFRAVRPGQDVDLTIEELTEEAQDWLSNDKEAQAIFNQCPDLEAQLIAVRLLSGLSYGVVRPAFNGTTAIGSLMRKKLVPVMDMLIPHLENLSGQKFH